MKMYIGTISEDAIKVKSGESYYSRQKKLFVMVVIVVSVVPLLIISYTASHYYRRSWLEKTSAELASLADSRKETISLFLQSQENLLAGFVTLYSLEHLSVQENLEQVFSFINRSGVIVDIGVIGRDGRHLSYVGPYQSELADKNYSDAGWFIEVMRSGRYVSDVFSGYRNFPHFIVAVTAPDRSWVMRATINSELFNSLLASAKVGPGGDAYIVNRKGELQTPSLLGINALPAGELNMFESQKEPVIQNTKDFLYAAVPLKNGDWTLVMKADINTSLAEFHQARKRDMMIIILASLVILTVATLLVRSMVNRIKDADKKRLALNNRIRQVEKMALVGRLAASVAHEINNPLQIIGDQAGWIDELLEEEDDKKIANMKEYRGAIHKIRDNVKRASRITHRLLGFSRSKESERLETDINSLVKDTAALLVNEARTHRISLKYFLEQNLSRVVTDASQLQQVFLNILNNAIDAIGQDGVITISTRRNGDHVVAEFADTGPGLSNDSIKNIFDPFFTTKEAGKGTGLGLSISYSIMQRLGGEIKAGNRKEGGSIFTVMLAAQ